MHDLDFLSAPCGGAAASAAATFAVNAGADVAVYFAAYAASADDTAAYRDHAGRLLARLLDVYEAGCWPLPAGWGARAGRNPGGAE